MAILRQLQKCPDVLQIHGVAESADYVYIITEVCRGGTLADYLKRAGPMSEAQCAHAMRTVLSAINACHRAGVEYGVSMLPASQPAAAAACGPGCGAHGCMPARFLLCPGPCTQAQLYSLPCTASLLTSALRALLPARRISSPPTCCCASSRRRARC